MRADSLLYYAVRLEEERKRALAATDPAVRAVHAEMAAEYEALVLGGHRLGTHRPDGVDAANPARASGNRS